MPVTGACHCGAVKITVPYAPGENPERPFVASCNCSFCRKSGSLVAYYPDDGSVWIEGETVAYIWGDRMISQHHCPTCGCFTDWRSTGESYGRIGVNARLLDGFEVKDGVPLWDGRAVDVRNFDNAD
jgi:hypothetical protein